MPTSFPTWADFTLLAQSYCYIFSINERYHHSHSQIWRSQQLSFHYSYFLKFENFLRSVSPVACLWNFVALPPSKSHLLAMTSHSRMAAFDNNGESHVIKWANSKAFDQFCHKGLLPKSSLFRFHPVHVSWMSCFFRWRTIRVRLDGLCWIHSFVSASIPQGVMLAPTLFLILLSSVSNSWHCFPNNVTLGHCLFLTLPLVKPVPTLFRFVLISVHQLLSV